MAVQRNSAQPAGITNASGQPEIVLELDGLVLSMNPPGPTAVTRADESDSNDSDSNDSDSNDSDSNDSDSNDSEPKR